MTTQGKPSRRRRFGLSPAMVVALVALSAAISGVAIAAPASRQQHKTKAVAASSQRGPRGYRGYRGYAGVVPQVKVVQSEQLTLNPGDSTYTIDPNNFQATCPAGYTVLGTGFNASIGNVGLVQSYGTFVGGYVYNDTNIQISPVYVQATCGIVPGGASAAAAHPSSEAAYHATLHRLAAIHP